MWKKIVTWWTTSKVGSVLNKIGKTIRQFLRWFCAAQLSFIAMAVLYYFTVSKVIGFVLIVWGILLLISELRQKAADKKAKAASQVVVTSTK